MSVARALASVVLLPVLLAGGIAEGVELPKRRSGIWEVATAQTGGAAGPSAQLCIDEKTDDLAKQLAAGSIFCSRMDVRREGDRYIADSVCRIGDTTATSRTVFTGNFSSGYTADIQAKYSPPLMGMSEGYSTITARWLGPCKTGMRPGDLILPNGTTINVFDTPARPPGK